MAQPHHGDDLGQPVEVTFEVDYPPATPTCFVARHTEVQIEKTASVERTEPGQVLHLHAGDVENVSDDSAAEGVVVTDAIPADIKITDVSWPGEGDPNGVPELEHLRGDRAEQLGLRRQRSRATLFGPLQPGELRARGDGRADDHPRGDRQSDDRRRA